MALKLLATYLWEGKLEVLNSFLEYSQIWPPVLEGSGLSPQVSSLPKFSLLQSQLMVLSFIAHCPLDS